MGFDNNIILKNLKEFNLIVASKAKLEEINIPRLSRNEEEKEEEKEKEKKWRFFHMVVTSFPKCHLQK